MTTIERLTDEERQSIQALHPSPWKTAGAEPEYRVEDVNGQTVKAGFRTRDAAFAWGIVNVPLRHQAKPKLQPVAVGAVKARDLLACSIDPGAFRAWEGWPIGQAEAYAEADKLILSATQWQPMRTAPERVTVWVRQFDCVQLAERKGAAWYREDGAEVDEPCAWCPAVMPDLGENFSPVWEP